MQSSTLLKGIAWGLAGLLAVVATLIWFAPAVMVDVALERATLGRLRLANASGTFWEGRGRVVLADALAGVTTSNEVVGDRTVVQGLVLPGELTWSIRRLPILLGMVDASLRIDGMAAPLRLSGTFNELRLSGGSLNLASMELSKLGSPWNTIRPSALIGLRWNDLTIRSGHFDGKMTIELRDASSVLTPVQPLGSYQIEVSANGPQAVLNLTTLKGPLTLTGSGSWSDRGGLKFLAQATADAAEQDRLQSFLALIGRREGEKTIIKIGA